MVTSRFRPLWPPPKMPVLPQSMYTDGMKKLQPLGYCWGSEIGYFDVEANHPSGKKTVTFVIWRGQLYVTIDSDYGSTKANHIWVDYDCDGIAEEHHYGDIGLRNEYGPRAWLCHPLKRVLDYWRLNDFYSSGD